MTESNTREATADGTTHSDESDRRGERAVSRRTVLKGGAVGAIAAAVGARAMAGENDGEDASTGGLGDAGDSGGDAEDQGTDPFADYEGDGPPAIDGTQPTDPDGDGLYEDLNGDGEMSEVDADLFSDRRGDPVVDSFPEYYDFSDNGEIDVADSVDLYQEVAE